MWIVDFGHLPNTNQTRFTHVTNSPKSARNSKHPRMKYLCKCYLVGGLEHFLFSINI